MTGPLPIGVMIPTLNCADRLRGHLASMRRWLDLASEVIIVDSHSTDGSVELLRKELTHPNLRFFEHPPGLYQSWNFGAKQLTAKYCYIATAGDEISRAGLEHLLSTAEKFQADVVLSKPMYSRPDGRDLPRKRTTLHHVLDELRVKAPTDFPRAHFFLTSVFHGAAGMMGSSASNLYRTAALQSRPFPIGFGHVGDTAWGVMNAFETRFAITPEICARFLIHDNAGMISAGREAEMDAKMLQLARETLRAGLSSNTAPSGARGMNAVLDEFESAREKLRRADREYDRLRSGNKLWRLTYNALRAKSRRKQLRQDIRRMWLDSLARFNF